MFPRFVRHATLVVPILAWPLQAGAQEPTGRSVAMPVSGVLVSPDRGKLLVLEPIVPEATSGREPELRLAGERINPRTNAQSRFQVYSALIVQPIGRGEVRRLVVPWKARIANPMWSPDGNRIAYTLIEASGVSLWLAEASTGESRMLSGPSLNAAFGNPCQWLPSGSGLLCARIPSNRGVTPVLNSASGELLQGPQDERLFEHYFTDQLVVISLSGNDRLVGAPGLHHDVQISPNGKYLLVETLHAPYSYKVTASRFPARTEVWELGAGAVVKTLAEGALHETMPSSPDAVAPGRRSLSWRYDVPATVTWVEALDGGDPSMPAKIRDRIYVLDAPFTSSPARLADLEFRSMGVVWGSPTLALVNEGWNTTGRARSWVINPSRPGAVARLLAERRSDGHKAEPGRFVTRSGAGGAPVLMTSRDGKYAYVFGAPDQGEDGRPYVERIELGTGKAVRWIKSGSASREQAVAVIDADLGRLIVRRDFPNSLPSYVVRELSGTPRSGLAGARQEQ